MCGSQNLLPPKDLSHHYSRVTKHRDESNIKAFYKYFRIPGIGNLAGGQYDTSWLEPLTDDPGLPNPGYFPYDTLEAKVANHDRFEPTSIEALNAQPGKGSSTDTKASHITVPHDSSETDLLRKLDLTTALQYGTAQGYPPLWTWIREFTLTKLHPQIPYLGGAEVILTVGSTDGFAKCIECFTNIWDSDRDWLREREGVLCEEFAYMNAIQTCRPRGLNVVPVAIDEEGMLAEGPGGLADVLANWDRSRGKIPHLMYTVTVGQNPTSGLMSLTRRKQVYRLCQQYDIIIVEDDPYWYLQYPSANELAIKRRGKAISDNYARDAQTRPVRSSGSAFLDSLVPSYLSIDVDGRVARLDTFSKTVAPGCRLGWITAQPRFVERLLRITETSTQQPSGFVQSLIAELILGQASQHSSRTEPGWQMDGWIRWLEGLRGNYERRMQTMSQILDDGQFAPLTSRRRDSVQSLAGHDFEVVNKVKLYEFNYPMGGMFLWLRVCFENHPLVDSYDHEALAHALWLLLTFEKYLVLVAPGTMFSVGNAKTKGWQYMRLCFAAVDDDKIASISKNFTTAVADFFELDDPQDIDRIIDDDKDQEAGNRLARLAAQTQDQWMINPVIC